MKTLTFSLIIFMLLAGCTSVSNDQESAHQVLVDFFQYLSSAQYEDAAKLFAGDYEVLRGNNPGVGSQDYIQLLQNACQFNGFQCLPVLTSEFKEQKGDIQVFTVEFSNPDGSLFVLGPCCGADETEQPPQSQFEFRVQKMGGDFKVLDLPVYVP